MKAIVKPALLLAMTGALALGSMTASDARVRPWVAGAAGFAVGAAVGAAAANAAYYGPGYYGPGPAYAYTGDPAYAAYAYEPGYYRYGYDDGRTRSWPPHYDPGSGYNSNTVAPWQDWKLQGNDY